MATERSNAVIEGAVEELRVRMQAEIDGLKAAGGAGGCVVCAARKAKDRDRLREVMRRKRARGKGGV